MRQGRGAGAWLLKSAVLRPAAAGSPGNLLDMKSLAQAPV